MNENFKLILASKSKYRAKQLHNLGLEFVQISPEVDESQYKSNAKDHEKIALELSDAKAIAVAKIIQNHTDFDDKFAYLIIGSDQVVSINNEILNKPGSAENAFNQLKILNGNQHSLITALTIIKISGEIIEKQHGAVTQLMQMYCLTDNQIRNYIQMDNPIFCAGSYIIESAGLTLFEKITGDDFTSITGLPLLKLVKFMRIFGFTFEYNNL